MTSRMPAAALAEFVARVDSEQYPCMYATRALRRGSLLFAQMTWDGDGGAALAAQVRAYLSEVAHLAPDDAAMVALVVFVATPAAPEDHERVAWEAIQTLIDHGGNSDGDVPIDHPAWALTFDGVRLFVNVSTPRNARRRSRNLGSQLTLVIQARDGIDHIAPLDARGDRIREAVRRRLDRYDDVPRSPDLSRNGASTNRDWKQYVLADGEEGWSGPCPLHPATQLWAIGAP
jgi:uncharacterized protein